MRIGSRPVWPLVLLLFVLPSIVKATDDDGDEDDGPSVGVRALFNEGALPVGHGCDTEEFETVKVAIQNHLNSSSTLDRRRSLTHRNPVNCAAICCPFAYGTCVVYHPSCDGYPTPSSNKIGCDRRRQRKLQWAEPAYDMEECNDMKLAALGAMLESINNVTTDCTDFMLQPTRLECYAISEYEEDQEEGDSSSTDSSVPADSGCSVAPNQYLPASKWYGSIYVGFDAPSAVVDFAGTAIDPSAVDNIWVDENVFTNMVIEGTQLTLTANQTNRSLSRANKSRIDFISHDGTDKLESLYSTGIPACNAE